MNEQNPVTSIVAELLDRLHKQPFEPFDIVLSNGTRHRVPTVDHLIVTRILRRVVLEFDDGTFVTINPLHVASLEPARRSRERRRPKKAA